MIERNVGFRQRLDHADMGKASGAATGKNKADSAPRDKPRETPDVIEVSLPNMVMRFEKAGPQREVLRQALLLARRMQEHQLRQAACSLFESRHVERSQWQGPIGLRQEEDAIRLSQAKIGPRAVGCVAAVEDHVVRRFEIREPLSRLLRRGGIK